MIGSVDQVIVLMDSSPIGCTSLMPIIPNEKIDYFVTDSGVSPEFIARMRSRGNETHGVD